MTSATTLRDHYNEEEDYLFVWITSSVIIYQHISNAKAAHSRMCCSNGIINLFVDVFTLLFWTRIRAFHFIKTCRKLNVGNSVIYYINWYEHKILIFRIQFWRISLQVIHLQLVRIYMRILLPLLPLLTMSRFIVSSNFSFRLIFCLDIHVFT